MGQIFGGSTPPTYVTDMDPSNIWGVYTPKICDGCGSVKYLGVYTPNIFDGGGSVKIFWGSTPPKYLTDVDPSNVLGGSTPPKYVTDVDPSNIWGSTPPTYLTEVDPSNILGDYTPKIFDGCGSAKYLGGLHPQHI